MRLTLGILLTLICSAFLQANNPLPKTHWDNTVIINDNWLYLEIDKEELPTEDDSQYTGITLPHTWNAKDVLQTKDYRRGGSWYRKNIVFSEEQLKNRNYIRFGAAGQEAKVYLNGKLLTHHIGGYSAFTCELNEANVGSNRIDVWVCNNKKKHIAPQSADFNFYGGIYRSVELISAPEISISRKKRGGPGVRVWSEKVNKQNADMHVTALIDNGSAKKSKVTVIASLRNTKGDVISKSSMNAIIPASTTQDIDVPIPDISNPVLWSPESPELYMVTIELKQKCKIIDEIKINHGFRWFKFTADKGFFLNGKPYKLNGINRHQDYFGEGNAIPLHRHLEDFKLIKEAGINWLRLAHYQQDDYMLQLCDQLGMLVWEEIPYVNNTPKGDAFPAALESMMRDLIEQHYNHTSIILWGMGNEVWMGDRGDGKSTNYDILTNLNDIIHTEDPVRKSVFVNGDNDRPIELKLYEIPDVFGYNLYRGWYRPDYNSLTARVNEIREGMPNTPLIISEFGVGSDTRIHSENPVMQDFSIEYQNDYLESHLQQFAKMDWLCGVNRWSFADFGAAHRGDSKPHVNQKGLVTFAREKKDIFYLLKSYWSKEPVLYIESPSWIERSGEPDKTYRVFSNMDVVELFLNGKSLGKQTAGFEWNLTLSKGSNKLFAKGTKGNVVKEHSFVVNYQKKVTDYKVSATNTIEDSKPLNAMDNDLNTYWCGEGETEYMIDLNRISLVNGVTVRFHNPSAYQYNTEILVSVDGKEWTSQFKGQNNKRTTVETFMFSVQQEIRYLKLVGKGNNKNDLNSYIEIVPLVTLEKAEKNLYEKIGAGEI